MLRGKLPPVWVDELQNVLWDAIEVGGALGVDQVVLGVHVDAMFWLPGLHPLNKIFQANRTFTSYEGAEVMPKGSLRKNII